MENTPNGEGGYNLYKPFFYNETNIILFVKKVLEQLSLWSLYQPVLPHGQGAVFLDETLPPLFDRIPFDPFVSVRGTSLSAISVEAELFALESAFRNFRVISPSLFSFCLFINGVSRSLRQPSLLHVPEFLSVMSRFPP